MKHSSLELRIALGERSYPIWIGADLLNDYARWRTAISGQQVLIVSNSTVAPLYLDRVIAGLQGLNHQHLLLPDGETHKTWDSTLVVLNALADLQANRDACVIALGGGVIGDLAGFAAACYMRGISYLHMPTTLLAQVDSSVGGKTGVNLGQGKNLAGAFHQPVAVVIDTTTLTTLPMREFRSGLAEIVKYGAIGDEAFFSWLENHADALLAREPHILSEAIHTSCRYKAAVVMRDERETGERALLNFGHTFGHALEAASGYDDTWLHGEAVAIGMVQAARLSAQLGLACINDIERLTRLLLRFDLPVAWPEAVSSTQLLRHLRLDKKNRSDRLRFILWRGVGQAILAPDIPESAVSDLFTKAYS